jgi:hypothetical protein
MAIYVKKSDVYVTEQGWMWHSLNLSLAEARIFGYIYGLTNSKRAKVNGYKGSQRDLATKLHLDNGGISRILQKLIDSGLLIVTDGVYRSAEIVFTDADSVSESADSVSKNADSVSKNADSVSKSADSVNSPLTTPLYKEINKEMERDNNIARNTIATQDPKPFDLFNEFLSAYSAVRKERCGYTYVPIGSYVNVARDFWNNLPSAAQRLLIRDIKSGKWYKERIDWVISDYKMPEPTNYNGSQDLNRMAENNEMVVAIYCEIAGIYTRQDAEDYGMQILRPFKMQQ